MFSPYLMTPSSTTTSCRSCGLPIILSPTDRGKVAPLCADCDVSKLLVLTVELNRVVAAELSSRPGTRRTFPNPYNRAGHDVIDFTPYAKAKAS